MADASASFAVLAALYAQTSDEIARHQPRRLDQPFLRNLVLVV